MIFQVTKTFLKNLSEPQENQADPGRTRHEVVILKTSISLKLGREV